MKKIPKQEFTTDFKTKRSSMRINYGENAA